MRKILGEASQRSMAEIVEETQPNKERSGKTPSQPEELKDYPSMLSKPNLHQEEEEEDSSPIAGKEWIKIGNEYFKNPVATTSPPDLRVIKEFATDPLFQSGQNDNWHKRKFEEAANTDFVPGSLTEFQNNGFTKYHGFNVQEKYVKLSVINELFMPKLKTEEVEGEKEKKKEEDLASCFSFRTKRRYLYYD